MDSRPGKWNFVRMLTYKIHLIESISLGLKNTTKISCQNARTSARCSLNVNKVSRFVFCLKIYLKLWKRFATKAPSLTFCTIVDYACHKNDDILANFVFISLTLLRKVAWFVVFVWWYTYKKSKALFSQNNVIIQQKI